MEPFDEIGAVLTRGNTDRYVATGDRPTPFLDDALTDPDLVSRYAEVQANFAFTLGSLDTAGMLDALDALPLEHRTELPDGTRVLAVHAAPGTDDGVGITADMTDAQLKQILSAAEADLVFVGHTHMHLDRDISGTRVVNLGSVSLPKTEDLRASWSLITATSTSYTIEHRRADYDRGAVIDALDKARHPCREWLSAFFRGEDPC
jgi:predicted phosphodiesterase